MASSLVRDSVSSWYTAQVRLVRAARHDARIPKEIVFLYCALAIGPDGCYMKMELTGSNRSVRFKVTTALARRASTCALPP